MVNLNTGPKDKFNIEKVEVVKKGGAFTHFLLGFFSAVSLLVVGAVSYVLFCPHFKTQVADFRKALEPVPNNVTLHVPPPKLVLVPVPSKTNNFNESLSDKPAPILP